MNIKTIKKHIKWDQIYGPTFNWNNCDFYKKYKKHEMSSNFLEIYKDKINWKLLSKYVLLTDEQLEHFSDKVNWLNLSMYQKLSENIIRKFQDKVAWEYIITTKDLSEDFIEEFKYKISWHGISNHRKLSLKFIRKYQDNLDWDSLGFYFLNQELFSQELVIDEFKDKINWQHLIKLSLSEESLIKYIKYFDDNSFICFLNYNQNVSEHFLRKYILINPKLTKHIHEKNYSYFSEQFIDEFFDKLDIKYICRYGHLSQNFMKKYKDKLNWDIISMYQMFSENFIREFKDRLNFKYIFHRFKKKLSPEFIKEFGSRLQK